jgi:hypothetical protein
MATIEQSIEVAAPGATGAWRGTVEQGGGMSGIPAAAVAAAVFEAGEPARRRLARIR